MELPEGGFTLIFDPSEGVLKGYGGLSSSEKVPINYVSAKGDELESQLS